MRTLALALLVVAACSQGDGAMFPLSGGGGGGAGGGGADANHGDSPSALEVLQGKVCLLTDPRDPTTCSTANALGYLVTLDGRTATTGADGAFKIEAPKSATLTWMVTGSDIAPSLMSLSTSHIIPIMKRDDYLDLENENGVLATAGYGDVFIHVTKANANVATVVAAPTPTPLYSPQYDGATAHVWQVTSTGSFGMIWLAQLASGVGTFATASTTLTPQAGAATTLGNIPVGDGALTWVSVELP
jgi:hypothetical protein